MRRYKRRKGKQRKILIISTCIVLLLMTAGYAAMQTNLEIKAKGNIIKENTGGEALLEMVDVVTTGDGLYADTYEEGRFVYKGSNPNNYITFNGELWRIISVENDNAIKIMRNGSVSMEIFDINRGNDGMGRNEWSGSEIEGYLNRSYLNEIQTKNPNDYEKILSHNWSVGAVISNNSDLANQIISENSVMEEDKVGLVTVSELLRANTNTKECGNLNLHNSNTTICKTTNWIISTNINGSWTISPDANYDFYAFIFGDTITSTDVYWDQDVIPCIYISSEIKFVTGTGTESNPFQTTI